MYYFFVILGGCGNRGDTETHFNMMHIAAKILITLLLGLQED